MQWMVNSFWKDGIGVGEVDWKPIRKLDSSLDALSVTAPHLQAAQNTHIMHKIIAQNT